MQTPRVLIRALKRQDVIDMYGRTVWASMRGFTAELEGRVIGVAGIAFAKPLQCFCALDDEMKDHPREIVKAVRIVRELLNDVDLPVYATPDEYETTADQFLKHVGFVPISEGMYQWPQPSQH